MMTETSWEIVLYQANESLQLEVKTQGENVWLNRQQLALLFDRDIKTIGKHINNALREELAPLSTIAKNATIQPVIAKFATTASDGKTYQMEYYNLDMILSVGYRIKSQNGIIFRRRASNVLKDYLLKGYAIHQRIEHLEQRITQTEKNVDFFVRMNLPPVEWIFYDGQVFDAYIFVSDLIKSAKKKLILIDNYLDDTILKILSKRSKWVNATLYTEKVSSTFQLDLDKHNAQYPVIEVKITKNTHDRFLIIDETVYHIWASIKDLGKKLFAFSKMELNAEELDGMLASRHCEEGLMVWGSNPNES